MKNLVWLLLLFTLVACMNTLEQPSTTRTENSGDKTFPVSMYFTTQSMFDEVVTSDLNINIVSLGDDLEENINTINPSIIYFDSTTIEKVDPQIIRSYYLYGVGVAGINVPLSKVANLVNTSPTMPDLKPLNKGFYISFIYRT